MVLHLSTAFVLLKEYIYMYVYVYMYSYFPCQVTFWTVSIKISLNRTIYYNFKQVFDHIPSLGQSWWWWLTSWPCGRESPWPPSNVVTQALLCHTLSSPRSYGKVQASWSYSLILLLTAVTIRDASVVESEHFPVNKVNNSEAIWLRKLFWSEMCAFLGSGIFEKGPDNTSREMRIRRDFRKNWLVN